MRLPLQFGDLRLRWLIPSLLKRRPLCDPLRTDLSY